MTSAELITELRAARPIAAGTLHDRVRKIAAAEPARRSFRFPRFSPRRFAIVVVPTAAVLLLGLAGVAGLLNPDRPQTIAASSEAGRQQAEPSVLEPAPQLKVGAATDATTPAPTTGRAQRYSAQLTLSVKDIDALSSATQQALRITRDLGGFLVTASYATSDTGVSTLTLKVPTANVQEAVVRLSALGKIVSQQVQIDDLQGQIDDLTKRETALRERIARLSARLAGSDLDAETRATLEARRDAARSDLARARVARAQVNAEARYATIQLSLRTSQSSAVPAVPTRWDRGLDRAGEILLLEAMIVLYALVLVGPIAVVAALAWLGRRELRRRQDEQLLSSP